MIVVSRLLELRWQSADSAMTTVTYVGHATVLIEASGSRVLTDPVLGRHVAHLPRNAAIPRASEFAHTDAVLISHAHYDHLDLPSLRRLDATALVIVPRGLARMVRRAGLSRVVEVEVGDRVTLGELAIRATPAEHSGRRLPLGRSTEALGYIVEGPHSVYFAGDTDIFDGMRRLASELDLALLPVAGWGARLPPGHLDPGRAARAAALLQARVAVPIHWGTLAAPWARPRDPTAQPREFARLAASYAPEVEVRILHPGERSSLDTV